MTTSLEAGELAVVMITCGGRNRGRMTHDGQRCERILRHPHPAIGSAGQYYQTFRAEETTVATWVLPRQSGCVGGAALKEARNGALADREAFAPQDLAALLITLDLVRSPAAGCCSPAAANRCFATNAIRRH